MKEKLEALITSLEKVPTNVWAFMMIGIGALLVVLKHEEAGKGLMMSGATVFTHKS